jgi:hypothetical protein
MANPYLPPPVEPKKKVKPIFIIAPVAAVAAIAFSPFEQQSLGSGEVTGG